MKTKNMLRVFFAAIFVLGAITTNAQDKVYVCKNDGTIDEYNTGDVLSLSVDPPTTTAMQNDELAYTPEKSTFQLWAPTADNAIVSLYNAGSGGSAVKTVTMTKADNGYWNCAVDGDQKGMFYTFKIMYNGSYLAETPGIWAKALGVNGNRAAIVDMAETNPEGWDSDTRPPLANPTDIIIYEMHIRDFSIDPNSGMTNKGKFMALTETGTKSADGLSTGLDHLKELGITHVQIMPAFDFDDLDETKTTGQNWGYASKNFNAPEGSYSTDPYTPTVRIKEFKSMVQALHKNGIRVIMDVVYHQTSYANANMSKIPLGNGGGSCFDLTYPNFFYRYYADGAPSMGSLTSYDLASEKPEVRNYIVESVKYWVNEYHVDGFRFDLMGLTDLTTMNLIRSELDKIDPSIFIVGEGWDTASALPSTQRTTVANGLQFPRIAVFSGDIRDALKGGNANSSSKGFVQGANEAGIMKFCISGATQSISGVTKAPYANSPGEVSNYASCHDGCCLLDFLTATSPTATADQLMRYNFLAQTIVFTSQGVPLILSGEELYRTKQGYNDTNGKPDSINEILWANKSTYSRVFEYYKDLIAMRKEHPAFRMTSTQAVAGNLSFLTTPSNLQIAYTLNGAAVGDSWKTIFVVFNGSGSAATVTIPAGTWTVVCDDAAIDLNGLRQVSGGSVSVKASSAFIAYQ